MGSKQKKMNAPVVKPLWYDQAALWVLVVCAAIVPLIVRLHKVLLDPVTRNVYTGNEYQLDFFSYNKSIVLTICSVFLLLYWLSRIFMHRKTQLVPMYAPLGIYAICILGSTFASGIYADIAWNGYPDRYEGATVLLGYLLLAFTAATLLRTEKQQNVLVISVMCMSVLIGLLGISQYFDFDFLKTAFGKQLMLPAEHKSLADTLTFNFGKGMMYTTVYNPNYLGSLSALLLPVAVGLFYQWIEAKKGWKILVAAFFTAMLFVVWLGGLSRAGLLGGGVAILLLLVLLFGKIIRHWKYTVALLVVLVCIYSGMDLYSNHGITREFANSLPTPLAVRITAYLDEHSKPSIEPETSPEATPAAEIPDPNADYSHLGALAKSADLNGNGFIFRTDMETIKLVLDTTNMSIGILDGEDKPLSILTKTAKDKDGNQKTLMTVEGDTYKAYSMSLINGGIVFTWKSKSIALFAKDGKLQYQDRANSTVDHLENPPHFGFEGSELFGSSRGYIWSRSIPMLKNTILLGYGPDTYAAHFPQNDIASKMNWLSAATDIVDKPHNWYLQMGINTGALSLLSFLVFIGWFSISALKRWARDTGSKSRILGISIFAGVLGYCIAGIFNDSAVSVAPIFWTMLGLGLAVLHMPQDLKVEKMKEAI